MIWEAASAIAAAGANRNIRRPVAEDARRRTGPGSLPSTDVANLDGANGIAHPAIHEHPDWKPHCGNRPRRPEEYPATLRLRPGAALFTGLPLDGVRLP